MPSLLSVGWRLQFLSFFLGRLIRALSPVSCPACSLREVLRCEQQPQQQEQQQLVIGHISIASAQLLVCCVIVCFERFRDMVSLKNIFNR